MPVETGFSVTFAIKAANQYGSAMKGNVGSRQVWGFFFLTSLLEKERVLNAKKTTTGLVTKTAFSCLAPPTFLPLLQRQQLQFF